MASSSLVDYYNTRVNFDKLNPLIRSAYNTTSDFEEYKQKLLTKVDNGKQDSNSAFLDRIEEMRHEQRVLLTQVEHDYYNQKKTISFDVPYYSQEIGQKQEPIVTSKPPLPTASRRSPSPVFVTEEQIQHHIYHRPISDNIDFCSHRTCDDDTITTTPDVTTSHLHKHIHNLWDEFELEDYLEKRK